MLPRLTSTCQWRSGSPASLKLWLGASLGPGPCAPRRSASNWSSIFRGKFKSQQAEKQFEESKSRQAAQRLENSSQNPLKDASKDAPKDASKDASKDTSKDFSKGPSKDTPRNSPNQDPTKGRNLLFKRGETIAEHEALTRSAMQSISRYRLRRQVLRATGELDEKWNVIPKTRRKRWHDPEENHGKQSLSYHLKHGKLKGLVNELNVSTGRQTQNTSESVSQHPEAEQLAPQQPESQQPKLQEPLILPTSLDSLLPDTPPDSEKKKQQPLYVPLSGPPMSIEEEKYYNPEGDEWAVGLDEDEDSLEMVMRRERYKDVPAADPATMEERYDTSERRKQQAIDEAVRIDGELMRHAASGFMGGPKGRQIGDLRRLRSPVTFIGRNPLATAASQFLYGRTVVQAALESQRRKLYRLYVYGGPQSRPSRAQCVVMEMARVRGVAINMVHEEGTAVLDKMSQGRPHNGLVLEASPLPMPPACHMCPINNEKGDSPGFEINLNWQSVEDREINGHETVYFQSNPYGRKPFILLLVGIMDPGNLGAVLRTAGYLGVDGVAIARDKSAGLTPIVLKAAAGATENLNIFDVDDPYVFVGLSQKRGWKVFAAVPPPDDKLRRLHPDHFITQRQVEDADPLSHSPCLLIFGNEGFGISKTLRVLSDCEVCVPRFSYNCSVDSLNVSVAAALLCQSFLRNGQPRTFQTTTNAKDIKQIPRGKLDWISKGGVSSLVAFWEGTDRK